jgi:hypothetical protein
MWFLGLIVKGIAAFLAAIFNDKKVKDTAVVIQEIEDAQRNNDVRVRDLGTVTERLRRDAATKRVGASTGDPTRP